MKKFASFAAVVVLALTAATASAQSAGGVSTSGIAGTNPRPQGIAGTNPRPQVVSTVPDSTLEVIVTVVLNLLGA